MINRKKQKLERLRSESGYPTTRKIIEVATFIFYSVAVVAGVSSLIMGLVNKKPWSLIAVIPCTLLLLFVVIPVFKESVSMMVDMADLLLLQSIKEDSDLQERDSNTPVKSFDPLNI